MGVHAEPTGPVGVVARLSVPGGITPETFAAGAAALTGGDGELTHSARVTDVSLNLESIADSR